MKHIHKKHLILIIGLFLIIGVKAQSPLSLYYLENIPQSSMINPAMTPRANGFLGIPGVNSTFLGINTDMFGSQLFQTGPDGNDITFINTGYNFVPLYKRIGPAANLNSYVSAAPLFFGFSGKRGYFTFSWNVKANESMAMPKDFFKMIEIGLFPDGTQLDFSPLALNMQVYSEFSAGFAYQFMKNLRVGAHVKFLQGMAAAKTDLSQFDIHTSKELWEIAAQGTIYTSVPVGITTDENNVPNGTEEFDSSVSNILNNTILNFSNPGFAIDFGAVYELNPAWTFSASVNDLGFIKWGGNLQSFTANGAYSFNGIMVDETSIDSLSGDYIARTVVDSLKNAINLQKGTEGFTTGLGPKIYLGAIYNVNHYFSVGAVSRTTFYKNDFQQEFNVSANLNLYHVLTTSLNYSYAINGANSVGLALGLRGGPLQFYTAIDYIPYRFRPYTLGTTDDNGNFSPMVEDMTLPTSLDNISIMFGFNLLFGANGFKDEPMIDAYDEF